MTAPAEPLLVRGTRRAFDVLAAAGGLLVFSPVVAAAVGGLTTVVRDGHSGLLVDGHEPGPWAEALRRVACDPAERARLAAGALAQAQEFSWDATADQTIGVYRRARSLMRESVG